MLQQEDPDLLTEVFERRMPLSKAVKKFKRTKGKKRGPKPKPLRAELNRLIRKMNDKPSVAEHLQKALEELKRLETTEQD